MKLLRLLLACACGLGLMGSPWEALAQRGPIPDSASVRLQDLPREARATVELVRKGGPYPYPRDGIVFSNREGQLPAHKRGYYREFTVKTPGERSRGARRIVAGSSGELYYTDDHYAHFRLVRE